MADQSTSKFKTAIKAVDEFATADKLFHDEELANLGRAGFRVACHLKLETSTEVLLFNPETLELLTAQVKCWNEEQKVLTGIRELRNPGIFLPDSMFTTETASLYLVAVV